MTTIKSGNEHQQFSDEEALKYQNFDEVLKLHEEMSSGSSSGFKSWKTWGLSAMLALLLAGGIWYFKDDSLPAEISNTEFQPPEYFSSPLAGGLPSYEQLEVKNLDADKYLKTSTGAQIFIPEEE
ncbi:hypothetical protein KFE98_16165 [bacterium SCSIO 12741]|nr:hypothetical protein KFE98_16165 [bacterium SCSIO 12741]